MTTDSAPVDPLWQELHAIEHRTHPRMHPDFGRCPCCGIEFTGLIAWGPVWYATCDRCFARVTLGFLFRRPPQRLDPEYEEQLVEVLIEELLKYDAYESQENQMMKSPPKAADEPFNTPFDPWPGSTGPQ